MLFYGRCRFMAARAHTAGRCMRLCPSLFGTRFLVDYRPCRSCDPKRWEQTKQSIRACNAVSGNGDSPDMVSFVGFEWTQVGQLPEDHFGHKNVIFKGLEDAELAKRPIASGGVAVNALRTNGKDLIPLPLAFGDFENRQNYFDIRRFLQEAAEVDLCNPDTPIADLPASCFEIAETPGALVDSLEAQKLDPLIIPHGTTWGFYTPVGVTFDKHLKAEKLRKWSWWR